MGRGGGGVIFSQSFEALALALVLEVPMVVMVALVNIIVGGVRMTLLIYNNPLFPFLKNPPPHPT